MTADFSLDAVGGPPYRWTAGLSFFGTAGFGQTNSQAMTFSSNPQNNLLDPGVATPLTVDNITWNAAPNPQPPAESFDEPMFDAGLSFVTVTGSA